MPARKVLGEEHYRALGHNFELDEDVNRAGFESALRRECLHLGFRAFPEGL